MCIRDSYYSNVVEAIAIWLVVSLIQWVTYFAILLTTNQIGVAWMWFCLFLFSEATSKPQQFLDGLNWELLNFDPSDGSGLPYEAIFLSPKTTPTATPPPLVVLPHGGPHVLFSTEFYVWSTCLAALGFACLLGEICVHCVWSLTEVPVASNPRPMY